MPLKSDGTEYYLQDIENNPEQEEIAYLVLQKIKEFVEFPSKKKMNPKLIFKPLELTVMGSGGTGKTFLIKVILSTIKRMFESNNSNINTTLLTAPTGAAAFNTNGRTCHSTFQINVKDPSSGLSHDRLDQMQKDLKYILFLCIDERSMLSQEVLGTIDKHTRYAAHDNKVKNKPYGGIPIIMLTGDDHQLPSVINNNKGHGAIYCLEKGIRGETTKEQLVIKMGKDAFLRASKTVRKLKTIERLDKQGSEDLRQILNELRNGGMTESHAEQVSKLHIRHFLNNRDKMRQIEKEALYLFATNEKRKDHNFRKLSEISGEDNPICLLKTKYINRNTYIKGKKSHFKSYDKLASSTIICIGAKVSIQNKNFEPRWGLYNGCLGTVVGIKFDKGKSPTKQDLPLFVVVDFPHYIGPPWIENHPTYIPIPTIQIPCIHDCCEATFVPLCLSFGRTIHTFQGMEAGTGKPIKMIVVDVGSTGFEGKNPGTLYTAISRASTIGNGNPLNSALYFSGELERSRLKDVIHKRTKGNSKSNTTRVLYDAIKLRNKWIDHLHKHLPTESTISSNEKHELKLWAESTTYSQRELYDILRFHKQH